jgi:hypothetical protein
MGSSISSLFTSAFVASTNIGQINSQLIALNFWSGNVTSTINNNLSVGNNITIGNNINGVPVSYFNGLAGNIQANLNALGSIITSINSNVATLTTNFNAANAIITTLSGNLSGCALLAGNNALSGLNTFNYYLPTSNLAPTSSSQFVIKNYTDTTFALSSTLFSYAALSSVNTFTGTQNNLT